MKNHYEVTEHKQKQTKTGFRATFWVKKFSKLFQNLENRVNS